MTRNGQIDHEDLLPTPGWCDFTISLTKHTHQHFACASIVFSSLIKVIIRGINENKKRKCFKWRTIAVGFKVYGWKNTVSKYWCINPFERILENSSKYFSECKLFGQNYFWKTHPLFFEISIFWSRAKANFWKPDPYLVNRLDEFSRNMSRSWTGFEHNLVVIKLAWMNFPGINLGPEICQ